MSGCTLKFWGVRGSIPTPQAENLGFGGNTTCVEVRSEDQILVIDGGTGVRSLGLCVQNRLSRGLTGIHVLLTHFHWDHVQGLPFFAPLYDPDNKVTFYSSCRAEELQSILEGQMSAPYFPVGFGFLPAKRNFVQISKAGQHVGTAIVHPFPLNHPQGATGFRIEVGEKIITHASDLEHGNPALDEILFTHAQDADVLTYDAQYTPEEYQARRGWGHSTWLEATRVASRCNVKRLILFHHDPSHDDQQVQRIVREARTHFEKTDAAKEGWEVTL